MTALWITLGAGAALLVVWRLRVANRRLGRILREEQAVSGESSVASDVSTPSLATDHDPTDPGGGA